MEYRQKTASAHTDKCTVESKYRLLLVDDEYLELELLRDNVDWESFGFVVCGTAQNGYDALQKVELLHPDSVITDIKMPVMDGVELSKILYNTFPNIVIAFLSGYNQFEYLKNAFRVNAVDYLIKPLDLDEIPLLMDKLRKKCDAQYNGHLQQDVLLSLALKRCMLNSTPEDIVFIENQLFTHLGKPTEVNGATGYYYTLYSIDEYSYLAECGDRGVQLIRQLKETLWAAAAQQNTYMVELQEDKLLMISALPSSPVTDAGRWLTVCCTDNPVPIAEYSHIYYTLNNLCTRSLQITGTGQCLRYPSACNITAALPDTAQCPEFNVLLQHIQRGSKADALKWISNYYGFAVAKHSVEACPQFTVELLDVLYAGILFRSDGEILPVESKNKVVRKALQITSPVVLATFMGKLITQLILTSDANKCDPTQVIIKRICEYIEQHYAEPLSIENLARQFNFSTNYLSSIFKKSTGKTILEYITDTRLQKSIYLLQETMMRVTQIAQAIGYSTPSYFCSLFFKKYGVTPNQYRSRLVK